MSERYSVCKFCDGNGFNPKTLEECGMCGETGFSGDAFELPNFRRKKRKIRQTKEEKMNYVMEVLYKNGYFKSE